MWAVIEVRENDGQLLFSGTVRTIRHLTRLDLSAAWGGLISNTLYAAWAVHDKLTSADLLRYMDMTDPDEVVVYVQGRLFNLGDGYTQDVRALAD